MSKQESLKNINRYLKLYNQEQLDLIEKVIEVYASGCINKGAIMDLAFEPEERRKIDSALPHDYVMAVKEILPCFDSFSYVFDYNEPNRHGAMRNVLEALHIKMQTVLNNANFEKMEEPSRV